MKWSVIEGDCVEVMRGMEPESVQCVVTSPPYWGLRDYGTATWDGGDAGCGHAGGKRLSDKTTIGRSKGKDRQTLPHAPSANVRTPYRDVCGKCGAIRIDQQLGLEATPEEYVEALVRVFREVRRVLRDDGTVWLNLGDSYATSNPVGRRDAGTGTTEKFGKTALDGSFTLNVRQGDSGLKPKDLVGIPWRVAFALQADGWWLRSDIVWAKPNPMPESVTDRPTRAHEYLFLLTKSARYFFDAEAVREANVSSEQYEHTTRYAKVYEAHTERIENGQGIQPGNVNNIGIHSRPGQPGRNLRSVWNIATEPFPGAHFATFPKKLVEPCVKAGSRVGDTVLDPFAGSGTVGVVSLRLGRSFVGIELNPEYAAMARRRIEDDAPLFNTAATEGECLG